MVVGFDFTSGEFGNSKIFDQFFYVWRFAFLINGGNDGLHVGVEIERALELTSRIIS